MMRRKIFLAPLSINFLEVLYYTNGFLIPGNSFHYTIGKSSYFINAKEAIYTVTWRECEEKVINALFEVRPLF